VAREPPGVGASEPATRSALAAMVRLGLTPADMGNALPSVTQRLSTPRKRQCSSSGEVDGSTPMRTLPAAWEKVLIAWVW
jgi:hypothetical protein